MTFGRGQRNRVLCFLLHAWNHYEHRSCYSDFVNGVERFWCHKCEVMRALYGPEAD